ncbi:hypothetical protein NO1_1727 [Candidatus Termititenax aidoneus]|uniref:Uncharacterized protein n=1 Tax=Termititenax aidoneus TaxID=2218524 RepID=A0A388TCI5_TERA1|nr:hypothetical protein NO1_1727 [Candidatus Termititenax aidoneus]
MKDNGIVRGEAEQAKPIVIGKDTVYIHTDIKEYDKLDSNGEKVGVGYEYHEVQYDKDEYLNMLIATRAI